jgi:hypothetical protein
MESAVGRGTTRPATIISDTLIGDSQITIRPGDFQIAYWINKNPEDRFRSTGFFAFLAERVGFEPTVRGNRTPDFESGTFDHSATFPGVHSLRSADTTDCFELLDLSRGGQLRQKRDISGDILAFQAPCCASLNIFCAAKHHDPKTSMNQCKALTDIMRCSAFECITDGVSSCRAMPSVPADQPSVVNTA